MGATIETAMGELTPTAPGAIFLLTACFCQTFLMEHAVTRVSRPAFVILQIAVYVAAAAIVGLLSTHDKDFLGPGPLPDVRPGFWGWWYNPDVNDYVKLPFMANPWYVHAGNLFYGFSNALTIWCVWQCMVVREQVSHGRVHSLIASFAFCSGALGHISQYLGFYGPTGDFMAMGMRIFVYFQGQVTSFYPIIWICYNRCKQDHVALVYKILMVILATICTALFTLVESGFFESISIGPNDMSYLCTQGWWHFQHVAMHVGYVGAAALCVYTMPMHAWNSPTTKTRKEASSPPKKKPVQPIPTSSACTRTKQEPFPFVYKLLMVIVPTIATALFTLVESGFFESISIGTNDMSYHPFVKLVLLLEGLFGTSACYFTRFGTDSVSQMIKTELFQDNYHGAVIFGSAIGAIGCFCLLTLALDGDPRAALIVTTGYHLSCSSLYIFEENDMWNKKAPKHYILTAINLLGMLVALFTYRNSQEKVHVE